MQSACLSQQWHGKPFPWSTTSSTFESLCAVGRHLLFLWGLSCLDFPITRCSQVLLPLFRSSWAACQFLLLCCSHPSRHGAAPSSASFLSSNGCPLSPLVAILEPVSGRAWGLPSCPQLLSSCHPWFSQCLPIPRTLPIVISQGRLFVTRVTLGLSVHLYENKEPELNVSLVSFLGVRFWQSSSPLTQNSSSWHSKPSTLPSASVTASSMSYSIGLSAPPWNQVLLCQQRPSPPLSPISACQSPGSAQKCFNPPSSFPAWKPPPSCSAWEPILAPGMVQLCRALCTCACPTICLGGAEGRLASRPGFRQCGFVLYRLFTLCVSWCFASFKNLSSWEETAPPRVSQILESAKGPAGACLSYAN